MNRRNFLKNIGRASLGLTSYLPLLGLMTPANARLRLTNPCYAEVPTRLMQHPLVISAWQDIHPDKVWDCHTHIAGIGDSDSGITINERMKNWQHPLEFLQSKFYINAGCAKDGRIDVSFIERLVHLLHNMVPTPSPSSSSCKAMLFAFDHTYNERGQINVEQSAFYVPNAYAQRLAHHFPAVFEWVCSIHPYREDALEVLDNAVRQGARAVKWLPPAMGIDPSSPRCDAFYQAMNRHNIPLITHAGEEKAVHGANQMAYGNPLKLRRALDAGVRVVIAHCASIGEDADLDQAHQPLVASFDLFSRLMHETRYEGLLFGDISALTLRNRKVETIRLIIEREDWHPRLLNGSDYPLPGVIPLTSPNHLEKAGLLPQKSAKTLEALQLYNPLLFDFVLKRHLQSQGQKLSTSIFHTQNFFSPQSA